MTPAEQALAEAKATVAQKDADLLAAMDELAAATQRVASARHAVEAQHNAVRNAEEALWLERDRTAYPTRHGMYEEVAYGRREVTEFAGRTASGSLKTSVRLARFRRGVEHNFGGAIRKTSRDYAVWCLRFGIEP